MQIMFVTIISRTYDIGSVPSDPGRVDIGSSITISDRRGESGMEIVFSGASIVAQKISSIPGNLKGSSVW